MLSAAGRTQGLGGSRRRARYRQTGARRPPAGDDRAGTPADPQDDRARGVLVRRDLVDRVRDGGDPVRRRGRRRRASRSGSNTLVPIAIVVAILLAIVVTSYRQTIFAYPSGGGSLRRQPREPRREPVAHRGCVAARRLHPHRRGVDLGRRRRHRVDPGVPGPRRSTASLLGLDRSSLFITLANLRGIKESGRIFAVPTYIYIVDPRRAGELRPVPQLRARRHPHDQSDRRSRRRANNLRAAARSACSSC